MLNIRINPPFKLLYDLRWMQLGQAGGIEQATYELVAAVSRLDRKNAYRVFAPRSACWEWDFPSRFEVARVYSDPGEPLADRFHSFVAHGGANADLSFDLVHSTCGYIHPELLGFPGVLTVNDLQHLSYPRFFAPADWQDRERLYRDSVSRAKHIICISEFTRQDVHERYGVPLERMTTIWIIPSGEIWQEIAPAKRKRLLAGMGIDGPFLFYPAHPWPHKNHERLIEAVARIAAELPPDLKLVLTGRPIPPEHPAAAGLREAGLDARVRHVGFRSALEIRALFQECAALVFPSLFEGFGMPVAEALIAGKPVACSNVTSLPEIAGDAAVTFDPEDVDAIARGLLQVATDAGLRAALSRAALARRHVFSSRQTALKTLAVYENVFAEISGRP